MALDDFSYLSREIPGLFFRIRITRRLVCPQRRRLRTTHHCSKSTSPASSPVYARCFIWWPTTRAAGPLKALTTWTCVVRFWS